MRKRLKPDRKNSPPTRKIQEQGAVIKKGKNLIKAALVYPNTYKAGMSSLGFQTVYRLVNNLDFTSCERVFLPDPRQKDSGPPLSVETGMRLDRFDIILFSISFENDYLNLVQLLAQAGLPLRSSDRNHTHPLVVAGGVACFLNPEPIAPFIDVFLLGEAECLVEPFFTAFANAPPGQPLLQTLEKDIPGAYVPALHPDKNSYKKEPFKIQVQFLEHLEATSTFSTILTQDTAFKDTFLIETLKGCPHGCRFCSAGFIYRPPRIYPAKNIYAAIDRARGKTNRLGLVSSAIADHPNLAQICEYGLAQNFKLSFSSLRADMLNDELIHILADSRVKTATIAPEAGSERMRSIINKKINENDILSAAGRLVSAGIMNLRLYFMIGLPFEQDEDVLAIVALTQKIKSVFLEASKRQKRIGTITLSINPFIPKPCTPFQWAAMAEESVLKNRVNLIRQGLKKVANVTVNIESLRKSRVHALLSRGDRTTADIIESALKNGWSRALQQNKALWQSMVYQERAIDAPLPWDFIVIRVQKRFLAKEWQRAKQEKQSLPCPMIDCNTCRTCI